MYTYKTIKTQQGMLKLGFQSYKVVSMSINLDEDKQVHSTYRVILGENGQFNYLSFVTFNQEKLTDFLRENPSGLYQCVDGFRKWVVTLARPTFQYRTFSFHGHAYVVIKIKDAGLVYNLLLGKVSHELPFMFNREKMTKTNTFDLIDLLNLGLLGRVTNYNYVTNHLSLIKVRKDQDSVTQLTFENPNNKEGMDNYVIKLDEEITIRDLYSFDEVTTEPLPYNILDKEALPGVVIEFNSGNEYLSLRIMN